MSLLIKLHHTNCHACYHSWTSSPYLHHDFLFLAVFYSWFSLFHSGVCLFRAVNIYSTHRQFFQSHVFHYFALTFHPASTIHDHVPILLLLIPPPFFCISFMLTFLIYNSHNLTSFILHINWHL